MPTCLNCGLACKTSQGLGTHLRARPACRELYSATPGQSRAVSPSATPGQSREVSPSATPMASRGASPERAAELRPPKTEPAPASPGVTAKYDDTRCNLETLRAVLVADHRIRLGLVDAALSAIDVLAAESRRQAEEAAAFAARAAATNASVEALRRQVASLLSLGAGEK